MKEEFNDYEFNIVKIKKYLNTLNSIEDKVEYMIWIKAKYESKKSELSAKFSKEVIPMHTFSKSFLEAGHWINEMKEHLVDMQKTEIKGTSKIQKPGLTDKIIWNRSRQSLEGLFNSLHKDGYISEYAQENIYEHFIKRNLYNLSPPSVTVDWL